MRTFLAAIAAFAALAGPARADLVSASPGAFLIEAEAELAASPDHVWAQLTEVSRWWSDAHTYSGRAESMSFDLRAGGCWCERWDGGEVEHGRLVMAQARQGVRTLRFEAALGPLQELGARGVLSFSVSASQTGSRIRMSYRVAGDAGLGLEALAPIVDAVMMEQFGRLSRLCTTGSPN